MSMHAFSACFTIQSVYVCIYRGSQLLHVVFEGEGGREGYIIFSRENNENKQEENTET